MMIQVTMRPQLTAKKFMASVDILTDLSYSKWKKPMIEAHLTVNRKFDLPRLDQSHQIKKNSSSFASSKYKG